MTLRKWILGGGFAAVALLAVFAMFGSSASAGVTDEETDDADIECEKVVLDDTGDTLGDQNVVEIGDEVAFEVSCVIENLGSKGTVILIGDALVIIDTLPDNFEIDSVACLVTAPGGALGVDADRNLSGQTASCGFAPGSYPFVEFFGLTEYILEVEGSFQTGPCGSIKNEAEASFGGDTETPVEFIFLECEDLSVTKTASTVTDPTGATVAPGGTIIYTVEICNLEEGFGESENVFAFDQLPLGAEFQSAASADFDLTFDGTSSQVLATGPSLQPGECGTIFITVDTADDAPCGTPFTNLAVVGSATGNTIDGDESNNSATVTTTVVCPDGDDGGTPGGGGSGPSVGTGNSGLLDSDSSVAGWQLGLLSLLIVASLSGAYVGYRRVR